MSKKSEKSRRRRFIEYILIAIGVFVFLKAPVMWFFTDFLELHYLVGGFIAGSIVTIINFLPSEFYIWRKKK